MTDATRPARKRRWLPYTAGGIAGTVVAAAALATSGVFAGGTSGRTASGSAAARAARAPAVAALDSGPLPQPHVNSRQVEIAAAYHRCFIALLPGWAAIVSHSRPLVSRGRSGVMGRSKDLRYEYF